MDLHEACEAVWDLFDEEWDLDIDVEEDENDCVFIKAPMSMGYLDVPLDFAATFDAKGSLLVYIQFGVIKDRNIAYPLVNTFNIEQPVFKAFVNENDRLEIQFSCFDADTIERLTRAFEYVLNRLTDEQIMELLKPITDITV